MLTVPIVVSNMEEEENLAIVHFKEEMLIRGGQSLRRGRLAKNVGQKKIYDKREEGPHKLVTKAYSILQQ